MQSGNTLSKGVFGADAGHGAAGDEEGWHHAERLRGQQPDDQRRSVPVELFVGSNNCMNFPSGARGSLHKESAGSAPITFIYQLHQLYFVY